MPVPIERVEYARCGVWDFLMGLGELSVPGVTRNFGVGAPGSLSTANTPAKWVRFPRLSAQLITAEGGAVTGLLRAEMLVAVMPVAQSTSAFRAEQLAIMMDNMWYAIGTADLSTDEIAISKLTFDVRRDERLISGEKWDVLIALIEGRG